MLYKLTNEFDHLIDLNYVPVADIYNMLTFCRLFADDNFIIYKILYIWGIIQKSLKKVWIPWSICVNRIVMTVSEQDIRQTLIKYEMPLRIISFFKYIN